MNRVLTQTKMFLTPFLSNPTINSVKSNNLSLKYQVSIPLQRYRD